MKVAFLLPGTTAAYHCGGLFIALKLARFVREQCPVEIVTYENREPEHRFLEDLELASMRDPPLWLITWGPHVSGLLNRLGGQRVVYYAQSPGWRIEMVPGVPILCLSRYLMAYWTERAPRNPVYLAPPALDPLCTNRGERRDIDVLYLSRKTTPYVENALVPSLRTRCRVETVAEPLPHDALLSLYNRSKVYLYDSKEASDGPIVDNVEGFGLQALEAVVCGCVLFSNLDGGLADFLDPGLNCRQVGISLDHDVDAIVAAVDAHDGSGHATKELEERYSEQALGTRLTHLLPELAAWNVTVPDEGGSREVADFPAFESWRAIADERGNTIQMLEKEHAAVLDERRHATARFNGEVAALRSRLDAVEAELEARNADLALIRGAKFWKLMTFYWRLRRRLRRDPGPAPEP